MRTKDYRRHQKFKARKRAEKYLKSWGYESNNGWVAKAMRKLADNFVTCSSACCGNPRKWWKDKTLQEKKSDIDFEEQVKDCSG